MKTQTVIELCSFGKRTILIHLRCATGSLLHLLNHLACPAEFSHTGDKSALQSWGFQSTSPMEAFIQEPEKQMLICMSASQGGNCYLPCKLRPGYARKRDKCMTPSYKFSSITHNGRLFGSVPQVLLVLPY